MSNSNAHEENNASDVAGVAIRVATKISQKYCFKTVDNVIYRYINGLYLPDGETTIRTEAHKLLSVESTAHNVNEVVNWIKRETPSVRYKFDQDLEVVNTLSVLLNIRTLMLRDHTPDYPSLIQIPVNFDPKAKCPQIRKFFSEVVSPQDILIIEELFGYCLYRSYRFRKGFLLVGEGSNGKTTLLELLRSFLGRGNCSSLTLQNLEHDRFAMADLFSKLANIAGDMTSEQMQHAGIFKMLTGGDMVSGDRKFKDRIEFVNFAKLVFSANRLPPVHGEGSPAFWGRLVIINFPNQFTVNADRNLLAKLTTPEELSGLLNLALKGLQRLLDRGDFSYQAKPDETAGKYSRLVDPVRSFVDECCDLDLNATIPKDKLYEAFIEFCSRHQLPTMSKETFGRNLKDLKLPNIRDTRPRAQGNGNRPWAWSGIKLREGTEGREDSSDLLEMFGSQDNN